MNLKPTVVETSIPHIRFLRDAKNLEWTVGNITLDASKLEVGQTIEPGTAVFKNLDTGLYELVAENTPATMAGAVLTVEQETVTEEDLNVHVSALRKASVYEELLHGVTDNFKEAVKGRIVFDV